MVFLGFMAKFSIAVKSYAAFKEENQILLLSLESNFCYVGDVNRNTIKTLITPNTVTFVRPKLLGIVEKYPSNEGHSVSDDR